MRGGERGDTGQRCPALGAEAVPLRDPALAAAERERIDRLLLIGRGVGGGWQRPAAFYSAWRWRARRRSSLS
jgi:hypothetical protein